MLPLHAVSGGIPEGADVELTTNEVVLIQATCDMEPHNESPLYGLEVQMSQKEQASAADALMERGLAEPESYRPDRELVRRLLIVSQPAARIVLLAAGVGSGERLLDVYHRAGAMVPYRRAGSGHHFGTPLEMVDVFDEVHRHFVPRRSTGDFIHLEFNPAEYFAFSACGQKLATKAGDRVQLSKERPRRGITDPTLDGAILLPGSKNRFMYRSHSQSLLPVPSGQDWAQALESLTEKDVLSRSNERYGLRHYLHDLAMGLATGSRYILTRFDYGAQETTVRDATLVPVPGSLFWLSSTRNGGLQVRELGPKTLKRALRQTIDELDEKRSAFKN